MVTSLRGVLVSIAGLLLIASLSSLARPTPQEAQRKRDAGSATPVEREVPPLGEIPADVVARALAAARAEAAGAELPPGYLLLEELTRTPNGATSALVLTPRTLDLLLENGMRAFLMEALDGSQEDATATSARAARSLLGDTTPPTIEWILPAEGATLPTGIAAPLAWTVTDENLPFFFSVDLHASFDGGATFRLMARGLNNGRYSYAPRWAPPYRPGSAILRLEGTDLVGNVGRADRTVTLAERDSLLPTTLRDFDLPGTQPLEASLYSDNCSGCHGNFDPATEPYFPWAGSMMAHSARDPLYQAAVAIAEQDAAGSSDLCTRCHAPTAWVQSYSTAYPDYDWQNDPYFDGVGCLACHWLVDPVYEPGVSPPQDADILASLTSPPSEPGNGSYVLDPTGTRRGPFEDAQCGSYHAFLPSPFHQEARLCGTCHDQSNPIFESDGQGGTTMTFDQAPAAVGADDLVPVDRTYSEWLHSAYNTPEGIYAPELGGNKDYVSTCQDCHMRDVTGAACYYPGVPVRDDQPFHDLTGGNTWVLQLIPELFDDHFSFFLINRPAIAAAVERARSMLRNAASLEAEVQDRVLHVTVTNETGHKLPTGFPHGRRMWLNVRFFDAANALIGESGHYDAATGVLTEDPALKVYEVRTGFDEEVAELTGLEAGASYHSVLNNVVLADNRIPPRGFTNAAFASFGGAPVGATYADGQHWDVTTYAIPEGTARVQVMLLYQTTSKEYIEFLRNENRTNDKGERMYQLWRDNDRCPPEVMAKTTVQIDRLARRAGAPQTPR